MIYCSAVNLVRVGTQSVRSLAIAGTRLLIGVGEALLQLAKWLCGILPVPFSVICRALAALLSFLLSLAKYAIALGEIGFDIIEAFLEYLYWLIGWLVWAVTWLASAIDLGLCALAPHAPRTMTLNVQILMDDAGHQAASVADVRDALRQASHLLAECGVRLEYTIAVTSVSNTRLFKPYPCGGGLLTSPDFIWFSKNTGQHCLTMYVVDSIQGKWGCALPGTNWFLLDRHADGRVLAHEIGHLCDLAHASNTGNLMQASPWTDIDSFQCCMFRTSRFARAFP